MSRSTAFQIALTGFLGASLSVVLAVLLAQISYVTPGDVVQSLRAAEVRRAIGLTFLCATAASCIALMFAIPTGYFLARVRFPGCTVVDTLLDVPALLSPVAVGLSLVLVLRSSLGRWVEQHVIGFLFEVPGIILAQFVLAMALQLRVLKSGFESIDPTVEQVARTLGLGPWAVFRRITLPMARPAVLAAFVLGWCRAAGDFGATAMVAGAIPRKTETIPIAIYLNLASVQIERAVVLALVLTVSAVIGLVVVRYATGGIGHDRS